MGDKTNTKDEEESLINLNETNEVSKFNQICRVCLCETEENAYKLNATLIFYDERQEIRTLIEESTGIQIDNLETLPNRICRICLATLKSWYRFRSQCQTTDNKLQKLSTSKGKESIPITVNDFQTKEKPEVIGFVLNCDCCTMKFTNQIDLDKHREAKVINAIPNNQRNTFQCDMCSKSFVFDFGLYNHKEIYHGGTKHRDNTYCKICGSFKNSENLTEHNGIPCADFNLELCRRSPSIPLDELTTAGERVIQTTKVSCLFCKENFRNKYELRPHVLKNHGRSRKCHICNEKLKTVIGLESHLRIHLQEKLYSCPICSRFYYATQPFLAHVMMHGKKEFIYRCNVCQKEFFLPYEFDSHMKTHLKTEQHFKINSEFEEEPDDLNDDENDGYTILKTEHDNENQSNTSEENESENYSFKEMETDFPTSSVDSKEDISILKAEKDSQSGVNIKMETDFLYDSKEQIEEIKIQEPLPSTSDRISEENADNYQFSAKQDKSEDIDTADEKLYDGFIKEELNLSTEEGADDTQNVSTSMESDHILVTKIFDECKHTCHIAGCIKEFANISDVLKHFSCKHLSKLPPFQCLVCMEQFQFKKSILSHIRKYYPYKCSVCSKSSKTGSELRKHIARMHCNFKKYECPKCKKEFKGRNDLNNHMITHSKSKDFSCEVCSKTFFSYNGLYLHSKSHMVIKELQCLYCSRQTSSKCRLRRHTKICPKRKELDMK